MTMDDAAMLLRTCARAQDISDCREDNCPFLDGWYRNGCERNLMIEAAKAIESKGEEQHVQRNGAA